MYYYLAAVCVAVVVDWQVLLDEDLGEALFAAVVCALVVFVDDDNVAVVDVDYGLVGSAFDHLKETFKDLESHRVHHHPSMLVANQLSLKEQLEISQTF